MRPIAYSGDQAMLYRIDVAVLDVPAKILLVADQVFPEPTLPNRTFPPRNSDRAAQLGFRNSLGEADLDQPPAYRKISVVRRQGPNRVNVFGQHDHRVDRKRVPRLGDPSCLAQCCDMIGEKAGSPIQQIDCEKPASTGYEGATIIRQRR